MPPVLGLFRASKATTIWGQHVSTVRDPAAAASTSGGEYAVRLSRACEKALGKHVSAVSCTSAKPCQKPRIPDRACSNYYSLGTQPTSADEPTLFPHVLTDPEARPKTDPGVHKRLQKHAKMLSPEYRRSKSLAGRVPAQAQPTRKKKSHRSKKNSKEILHPFLTAIFIFGIMIISFRCPGGPDKDF